MLPLTSIYCAFFPYIFQEASTYLGKHTADFFIGKAAHFCGAEGCNTMGIDPEVPVQRPGGGPEDSVGVLNGQ